MRVENAFVGARGFDSVPFSTAGTSDEIARLAASFDFLVGYLGSVTVERLALVLRAGMAFMPVTYAGEAFDGADDDLRRLEALGVPKGVTVWLDLEGEPTLDRPFSEVHAAHARWARDVNRAGYLAGIYVGSPQPFTAAELAIMPFVRYWSAPSRLVDRLNRTWDEPAAPETGPIGYCMRQLWPSVVWSGTGVLLDVDFVGQDRKGRIPTWMRA